MIDIKVFEMALEYCFQGINLSVQKRLTEAPRSVQSMVTAGLTLLFLLLPFLSEAGNNKWTTNGPFGGTVHSFFFHPTNPDIVFAGLNGGLFRSRNGGTSWKRLSLETFQPPVVRIHPQKPNVMLVSGDHIFRSTDEGQTFELVFRDVSAEDMEFHPADPNVIYGINRFNGILKSTDSGTTWVEMNNGLKVPGDTKCCGDDQIEVSQQNGNVMYALFADGKIYKSINGARSWKQIQKGIPKERINSLQSLAVDPADDRIVYLGGLGIFKTDNGGKSWSVACQPHKCNGMGLDVDPKNPLKVYSSDSRSTDGGKTWIRMEIPVPCVGGGIRAIAAHPKSTNILLAGAAFIGGIFRSKNSGIFWQPVNRGIDASLALQLEAAPSKPGFLVANVRNQIQISQNSGKTWRFIPELTCFSAQDFQIHPANPELIVAAGGHTENFAISRNSGKTWEVSSPFVAARAIRADPVIENIIYVAPLATLNPNIQKGVGVSKSTDHGKTWKLVNAGLTGKEVSLIRISPHDHNLIFVGTKSGKIFRSSNGGKRWTNSSSNLREGFIRDIEFDPKNPRIMYATSAARIPFLEPGAFYKSTDGGRKWVEKTDGMPESVPKLTFITIDPANPQILFTGGAQDPCCASAAGGFFISTNGAESWSAFDTRGLGNFGVRDFVIDPSKSGRFFIGADRGVFAYTSGGSSNPEAPDVIQISPSVGKVGDLIRIVGTNFGPSQSGSTVSFAGADDAGSAESWSETEVSVRVPAGVRIGPLSVTVSGLESNPFEFIVLSSSGSIEPASGSASGDTQVAILDEHGAIGSTFNVLFGSTTASNIRVVPPNIIVCTSPAGTGTVDVTIQTNTAAALVGTFTYQ